MGEIREKYGIIGFVDRYTISYVFSDEAAIVYKKFITQERLQYGREEFETDQAVLDALSKQPVRGTYLLTTDIIYLQIIRVLQIKDY